MAIAGVFCAEFALIEYDFRLYSSQYFFTIVFDYLFFLSTLLFGHKIL